MAEPAPKNFSGTIRGFLEVNFGCATCPSRRSVVVAHLVGLNMTLAEAVPVPFSVNQTMHVETREGSRADFCHNIVSLDYDSCKGAVSCDHAPTIATAADELAAHPEILKFALEPGSQEFGFEPGSPA